MRLLRSISFLQPKDVLMVPDLKSEILIMERKLSCQSLFKSAVYTRRVPTLGEKSLTSWSRCIRLVDDNAFLRVWKTRSHHAISGSSVRQHSDTLIQKPGFRTGCWWATASFKSPYRKNDDIFYADRTSSSMENLSLKSTISALSR